MVYLQITLKVRPERRPAAAEVYAKFKPPFLKTISSVQSIVPRSVTRRA